MSRKDMAFPYQRSEILVYSDEGMGASPQCVAMTVASLTNAVSKLNTHYTVRTTTSAELKATTWQNSCQLLVMPGGRDLPYCKELDGTGNANIGSFVRSKGGSYLGICAGAYYGSEYVEFDKGDPKMEVVGPRELAFFYVKAKGPAFPGYAYGSNAGAHAASGSITDAGKVVFGDIKDETVSLFFNGGCLFLPYDDGSGRDTNVGKDSGVYVPLLKYTGESQPANPDPSWAPAPAIIGGGVGTGRVVLTGLHFEASVALLEKYNKEDSYVAPLIPTLEKFESEREQMFNSCVGYLLGLNPLS